MTTYSKPAVRNAWGETAGSANLQDPGNTYAETGWVLGQKPPRQYFNWVLNYTFAGIRYLCQQGIPTWDASETYSAGSYVIGPAGGICRSLQNNNINQNPNTTIGTWWGSPTTYTAASNSSDGSIANTFWVTQNFLGVGTTFSGISGPINAFQVPVGAVTQWQGSLSIGGGQVNSAVQKANQLLLQSSGNYAAFNYVGQSGQPTWLFGTNDGANVYVWNPSNFSVANAATLGGVAPSVPAAGSSIVQRDSSGYTYSAYFSQSSPNNEGGTISQIMVTNGADNFLRKASTAAVKAALGALASSDFPASLATNGYQKLPSGIIFQWGEASISGTTTVTFPISFPTNCVSVVFTNINSTNQIFLNGAPLGKTSFSATNGTSTISWMAVGF